MKKAILSGLLGVFTLTAGHVSYAQKGKKDPKSNPKYTHYFNDVEEAIETREVVLEFSNGIARRDLLKFKTKFTNNTNDFLLIDPSQFKISVNGVTHQPKEKVFILNPNDKKSKTIGLKGTDNLLADEFEVEANGFARISRDGKTVQMEPFRLPAAVNVISEGNFEVNLKRLKQETKETWARFEIKYKGEGYAIIDPSRVSVKTETGEQYANNDRKSKAILLQKGESKTINAIFHIPAKVVDMQFAKLYVQWDDCMVETKAVPFEVGEDVTFELNEELTSQKNK